MTEANQVPLVELLSAVPADIRIGVDDGNDWKAGTTWHPVGLLCHEAAAELRRLEAELERKSDAIQRLWKERDMLQAVNAQLLEALLEYKRLYEEVQPAGGWQGVYETGNAAIAAAKGEA